MWENPNEFYPESFLGNSVDVKGNDFIMVLPFRAGRRMCPAYSQGLKMVQISLANLLHGNCQGIRARRSLVRRMALGLLIPKKIPLEAVSQPRL